MMTELSTYASGSFSKCWAITLRVFGVQGRNLIGNKTNPIECMCWHMDGRFEISGLLPAKGSKLQACSVFQALVDLEPPSVPSKTLVTSRSCLRVVGGCWEAP